MRKVDALALLATLSFGTALVLPFVLGDLLFYYSDPYSLAVALSALTMAVFFVYAAIAIALAKLAPRFVAMSVRIVTSALGAAVVFGASYFGYRLLEHALDVKIGTTVHRWTGVPLLVPVVLALLSIALIVWQSRERDFGTRLTPLGLPVLIAVVAALGVAWLGLVRAPLPAADGATPKTLALIVIDGLPGRHFSSAGAARTDDAATLSKSCVRFEHAYTAAPYTHGYFGALYSGERFRTFLEGSKAEPAPNLLDTLARDGVFTRMMLSHVNPLPFVHQMEVSNARLRSFFLTRRYKAIPEFLKLDYDLVLSWSPWGRFERTIVGTMGGRLFRVFNPELDDPGRGNPLLTALLPEIRNAQRHPRSFLLYHGFYGPMAKAGSHEHYDELRADIEDAGHANGYHYDTSDPDQVAAVAAYDETVGRQVAAVHRQIAELIDAIQQDPALGDVTVIVTADHGSIYGNGLLWYGHHVDEDVIRVPLLVCDGEHGGSDERLVSTADLTRSVLAFQGLDAINDGHSLFDPRAERTLAHSLALPVEERNEWFLAILRDGHKYVLNLHPRGVGHATLYRMDGLDEIQVEETEGIPPGIAADLPGVLAHYRLKPAQIHAAFGDAARDRAERSAGSDAARPSNDGA